MEPEAIEPQAVTDQLARILASPAFARGTRSSALLGYIVEQTLAGRGDRLKEYTLGADALNRGESFDPRTDPVVRAEVSRLRSRLDQYYRTEGRGDAVLICLPKGSYAAHFELREAGDGATAGAPAIAPATAGGRPFTSSTGIVAALAVVSLLLAVALFLEHGRTRERAAPIVQLDVELSSDGTLSSEVGNDIAISADGTRIVYVSRAEDGRSHLNTRRLDQRNAIALPGTEGARVPFFSPDGRWVGFGADGKLKKTAVDGGLPVILCEANDLFGASWGDDTIVAAIGRNKLWRVPVAGGTPQLVLEVARETTVRWPDLLPDGDFVLYSVSGGSGPYSTRIEGRSLRDGRRLILADGTFGRYLAGGYFTYINQGTLYAKRFDPRTLTVESPPTPIIDNISYSHLFGYAQVVYSATGVLVYRKSAEGGQTVIDWFDRSGRRTPVLTRPGNYGWPTLSPDARFMAVAGAESGARTLLLHDLEANTTRSVATRTEEYAGLVWYGRSILYGGSNGMLALDVDDPARRSQLTNVNAVQVPWSLAPGGARLAFYERDLRTGFDLWTAPMTRDLVGAVKIGVPEPFLRTAANETGPAFSSDGRWLAYTSNESGTQEIYVRRFPDGVPVRVSTHGGSHARWSANGHELLYRTVARRVMVVKYRVEGDSFRAEPPQPWPSVVLAYTDVVPSFDIAPDGERILAIIPNPGASYRSPDNHATFVFNFQEEVRRRVAAKP